jgi:hypothetical protein
MRRDLVELLGTTRAAGKGKMLFTVFVQYHRMLDARDACTRHEEEELFVMMRAAYMKVKGVDFLGPPVTQPS